MMEERVQNLKKKIEEIRLVVDKKTAVHLELDKCRRMADRLESFSEDCVVCQEHFRMLEEQFTKIMESTENLTKEERKEHTKKIGEISKHLQEEHKLITENYYMSTYMSLGIGFGLLLGLLAFDNVGVGLPIGMILGMSVGMAKDKEMKKQGKVI